MTAIDHTALTKAQAGDADAFAALIAPFRRELRALCYRMAGSLADGDDLLQDALVRIWRGIPTFAGRASLRTWIYRVATRACLDSLQRRDARVLPTGLGPPMAAGAAFAPPRNEPIWIGPCPTDLCADERPSPEARYAARESISLAFVVALQTLPPRQRAALVLRDVLGLSAEECAELLDSTVGSVNSALDRARASVASRAAAVDAPPDDPAVRAAADRYVRAWEQADVGALVALLREDATLSMPPLPDWLQGAGAIGAAIGAMVLTPESRGNVRLVPIEANGATAFAMYARDPATGAWGPQSIHVLRFDGDRIAEITAFLEPSLFGLFALAESL